MVGDQPKSCVIMAYHLQVQSLLLQLTAPDVRKDFLAGAIIQASDLELLLYTLDHMMKLWIPSFKCGDGIMENVGTNLHDHVVAMFLGQDHIFAIPSGRIFLGRKGHMPGGEHFLKYWQTVLIGGNSFPWIIPRNWL